MDGVSILIEPARGILHEIGAFLPRLLVAVLVVIGGWLVAKLLVVGLLVAYHFWLGAMVRDFARDANRRSHVFYRWINEAPLVLLAAIVVLVVVKPF